MSEFSKIRKARYIPKDERERLILCQTGSRYEKRNIALLRLGFGTGMRACELRDLCFYNLFDQNWQLLQTCHIYSDQTKGGYGDGDFYVLGKKTRQAILDYLEWRREKAKQEGKQLSLNDPLFHSQKGGRFKEKDLIILIKRIFRSAGVEGSSHSFRRTFATNFTKNNKDVKALQVTLRHRSAAMSLGYVFKNSETVKEMIINAGNVVQD